MGVFDEIRVKCDLPVELPHDHRETWFQSKDIECAMKYFEIREDGSLWKIETAKDNWTMNDWEKTDFTGEFDFYTFAGEIGGDKQTGWLRLHADFERGQLLSIELLEYRPA